MKQNKAKSLLKKAIQDQLSLKNSTATTDGLNNMLFYFDTIWEDRWWDSGFMLRIIDKKLQGMQQTWHESHYIGWKKDLKDITKARKWLKMIMEDKFKDKMHDKIEKKYPLFFDLDADFQCQKADKMFKKGLAKAQEDKNHAKKQFFKYFKKFENWWD